MGNIYDHVLTDRLKRWNFALRKPRYYRYAEQHILCECPRCFCPHRRAQRYSFTYVSESQSVIYYDVPKCASSTIRQIFFGNNHTLSLVNPQKSLDHYFKFSFVRDPWDRMVSNWKMFTSQPFRIKQIQSMTDQDVSRFEDFVYFARRVKNHHWQPQVLYLPDKLDFLGRLETFEHDFKTLCDRIGIMPVPVIEKRNTTARSRYQDYYTPTLVDVVAEMYAEDIQAFGFEFGASRY